ncbi:actin-related protein 2/3 complex subunit 1A-like isoform X1 [Homarus americanus]|uniref:actin-related protein 2/3 complex subunit 1A-like isoform X1 n=1 Tax=Homarus americanus TaxID=6706 RepID=UPI001C476F3F|nr:actin-related protein 2/3 complex subunit 1A-like isoform X1 [Homarus americanus]XP_042209456.1 actin-related protein 2/3 complex subunit 1A-like isoform X1 [Homarus americanus]
MTEVFRFGLVPIACRARNEDRSQVALSLNNNEVNIYGRAASEWKLQETLQGHDLRVTGIDWAPSTNRIVTCGANEYGGGRDAMALFTSRGPVADELTTKPLRN